MWHPTLNLECRPVSICYALPAAGSTWLAKPATRARTFFHTETDEPLENCISLTTEHFTPTFNSATLVSSCQQSRLPGSTTMRNIPLYSIFGTSGLNVAQLFGRVRTKLTYQKLLPKRSAADSEQKVLRISRNIPNISPAGRKAETLESLSTTASVLLKRKINQKAKKSGHPDSHIAREHISSELRIIDSRLEHEDVEAVLKEYSAALASYESPNSQQWIIRLYNKDFIRLRLVAREIGVSASKLAALLIAKSLNSQSSSPLHKKDSSRHVTTA